MKVYFSIFFSFFTLITFSQWECRSNLTGYFKPITEGSNFNWAAELNGSVGLLSADPIANGMAFLGLDYTNNNHQIYFEGAYKYWYKYDAELSIPLSNSMFGLRELSYNYLTPYTDLRIGLQQIKMEDYILVNERAWGANLSKNIGGLNININAATVTKDYARNGTFCANCYLYDIVPSRNQPLGNYWGETNFASLSFNKKVESKNSITSNSSNEVEEFSEFESFEDVESEGSAPSLLQSYGGFVYSEFGSYYNDILLYAGGTAKFALGKFAELQAEGIYQQAIDNKAFLIYLNAKKVIDWKSSDVSTINASYLGKLDIDDNAVAMPRFSNLFMGEVLRMDMVDIHLVNFSVKHQFVDKSLSFKLAYTRQIKGLNMEELDFSIGTYLFNKHLKATVISGLMNSDELIKTSGLAKMELRVFF